MRIPFSLANSRGNSPADSGFRGISLLIHLLRACPPPLPPQEGHETTGGSDPFVNFLEMPSPRAAAMTAPRYLRF